MSKKGGFVLAIIPVLLVLVIASFYFIQKGNFKFSLPSRPSSDTPTPMPLITLTPSPTPKPLPSTTPVVTVKPTQAAVSGPPGAGFSSIKVHTEKGDFSASVLSIDLNLARMITDTGNDGDCGNDCTTLPLGDYVAKNGGFAGVNGTYFCPIDYAECASKKNSFDFSVYNTRLGHWINAGMLSWGSRSLVYFDGSGAHYLQNANSFSGGLTAGIVNYPGLLDSGNVQIDDAQSGLSDKQKAKGTKVMLGVRNPKSIMVVIAYSVTMQEAAYVMKSLGATGALNLDDGGSTALYYNGRYLVGPGRALPNAVIFAH